MCFMQQTPILESLGASRSDADLLHRKYPRQIYPCCFCVEFWRTTATGFVSWRRVLGVRDLIRKEFLFRPRDLCLRRVACLSK